MQFINPLKTKYPIVIRTTALIGILLITLNFLLFPRFVNTVDFENVEQVIIENIDIPQTQQIDNTPPPARPSIPASWAISGYLGRMGVIATGGSS